MTPLTADDRAAFLRRIVAEPTDDLHRLVFADALDEHGDPLGEFVRVQCELAALPAESRYPNVTWAEHLRPTRHAALRRRELELVDANARDWLVDWAGHWAGPNMFIFPQRMLAGAPSLAWRTSDGVAVVVQTFRRGFVEAVTLDWPAACAHLGAVLAAAPVTEVTLTTWPEVQENLDAGGMRLVPEPPGTFTHGRFRLFPVIGLSEMREQLIGLLNARWPQVKSWHLPPAPHHGPPALPDSWLTHGPEGGDGPVQRLRVVAYSMNDGLPVFDCEFESGAQPPRPGDEVEIVTDGGGSHHVTIGRMEVTGSIPGRLRLRITPVAAMAT